MWLLTYIACATCLMMMSVDIYIIFQDSDYSYCQYIFEVIEADRYTESIGIGIGIGIGTLILPGDAFSHEATLPGTQEIHTYT